MQTPTSVTSSAAVVGPYARPDSRPEMSSEMSISEHDMQENEQENHSEEKLGFETPRSACSNKSQALSQVSQASTRACVLCQYHGNTSVITKRILAYMEDAVSHVHRDEICQQVCEELHDNSDLEVSPDDVRVHMEQHMINKHIILSTVVSDLMGIARASKQSCMLASEETGQPAVDPKYAGIYFKAVDQLTSILRSDAFKSRSVAPGARDS
jgi:hypothetical protein